MAEIENTKIKEFLSKVNRQVFIDSEEVCGNTMIDIYLLEEIMGNVAEEVFGYFEEEE